MSQRIRNHGKRHREDESSAGAASSSGDKKSKVVASVDPLDESNFFSIKRQLKMGGGGLYTEHEKFSDSKVWDLSKEQKMQAISAFCEMLHAHVPEIHERVGEAKEIYEKLAIDPCDGFDLQLDYIIHLDMTHPILAEDNVEEARAYWSLILKKPRSIDPALEQAAKQRDWKAFGSSLTKNLSDPKWLIAIHYAETKEDVQALQQQGLPWNDMHRDILHAIVHYHLMSKSDPRWFSEFMDLFLAQLTPVDRVEDEAILTSDYIDSRLTCLKGDASRHKALLATIEKFKGFLWMDNIHLPPPVVNDKD